LLRRSVSGSETVMS